MEPEPNAADPASAAEQFSALLRQQGLSLDFSLASLDSQIDRILDLPLFRQGRELSTAEQAQNESGLAAYIGETLRRKYSGQWAGEFYPDRPPRNYYTSFIRFGQFRFFPSHYVAYRLSNGRSEGTFADYLQQLIPQIEEATRR